MGAEAYDLIARADFWPGTCAVEIGGERGEGSTSYLSAYCDFIGVPFYSVDIDPHHERTQRGDGETFLRGLLEPVAFCYLDNFDYVFASIEGKPWVDDQRARYAEFGLEMNNRASEIAHLRQAQALHVIAIPGCLVVIDDTWADLDGYHGKGARAVPWLIRHGWHVERADGDQWDGYFALRRFGR